MPRKSEFSQETADIICERLSMGESLRSICRDEAMPVQSTVFKWMACNEVFAKQYAYAREAQADTLADEIVDIADQSRKGVKTVTKANGDIETTEIDMVDRARLQVDARKWVAAKLKPKKYGDISNIKLSGDPEAPLQLSVLGAEALRTKLRGAE